MIDAKEMRLGNHIRYADHKVWRKKYVGTTIVIEIDIFPEILQHPDRFDPIPLTPEILEACGGKNKGGWTGLEYLSTFGDDQTEIVFQLMDGTLTVFAALFPIYISEKPNLHQLQNLYFALTGQELTINLPIAQKSPV